MAKYEMRIYSLDSEASADAYEEVWRRHIGSLSEHGVQIVGLWRPLEKREQLAALSSMPENLDLEALGRAYFMSPGFLADFDHIEGGFDAFKDKILGVQSIVMAPFEGSPMQ